jgi:endonuclease III related protein
MRPGVQSSADSGEALQRYFRRLLDHYGPQGWWPASTRLEVILGAILTQNTNWQNVSRAIQSLRRAGLLNLVRLRKAPRAQLQELLRPAGYYRQKTQTIRNFLAWLDQTSFGSLTTMFARPAPQLRRDLLQIKGLGEETVDAILLYAGQQPYFVADAYTRRILARHGWVQPAAGYAQVQQFLHGHLPADPKLFNEFHALLVEVGKRHCRRSEARCAGCPLEAFLPSPRENFTPHECSDRSAGSPVASGTGMGGQASAPGGP